jgi:putative nucleotidyltransferase with HDIG domain
MFGSGSSQTADIRKDLWSHALTCGCIARTLAATTGMSTPDEAFLAGVVHDIGKLFFVDHRPEQYGTILANDSVSGSLDRELNVFGIGHPSVGGECGRTWGLPDELTDVITFHHCPGDADFGGDLVDIVSAANRLTRIWPIADADSAGTEAAQILSEIDIDLSPEEITCMRNDAVEAITAVSEARPD